MNPISNIELWNTLRKIYPQFASHTAKATAEMFTEKGFDALTRTDVNAVNDFFGLSIRVYLNQVNISHAKDTLESNGFGEYYDMPWGGYIQRMAVDSIKPISPRYKGLQDGDSPDPFVVRKPKVYERFFRQNFDYASLITMPDEFQKKQIFISEFGMSEFVAGIYEALQNGYTIQKYENKLEALNAGINSTKYPLQSTQNVNVEMSYEPTDAELRNFIIAVNNTVEAMTIGPQTGAFNALGYRSTQDESRLKMLIRPGIKSALNVRTLSGAFNPEKLGLNVDLIVVPHFGGLKPFTMVEDKKTYLYPVYNSLGENIGFSKTADGEVEVSDKDVEWEDPNENVLALLADKGMVFECRQNPYSVESIRNPRGLYTNLWASSPNNSIAVDPLYNMVTFTRVAD